MKKSNQSMFRTGLLGLWLMVVLACSRSQDEGVNPGGTTRNIYLDGVYTARGEYGGLPSHIDVTATLQTGLVTKVEVRPLATDPTSLDYQRRFAEAVPREVESKHIDEVNVGRLAGSSGTPNGFNDAIRQIKAQALSR